MAWEREGERAGPTYQLVVSVSLAIWIDRDRDSSLDRSREREPFGQIEIDSTERQKRVEVARSSWVQGPGAGRGHKCNGVFLMQNAPWVFAVEELLFGSRWRRIAPIVLFKRALNFSYQFFASQNTLFCLFNNVNQYLSEAKKGRKNRTFCAFIKMGFGAF